MTSIIIVVVITTAINISMKLFIFIGLTLWLSDIQWLIITVLLMERSWLRSMKCCWLFSASIRWLLFPIFFLDCCIMKSKTSWGILFDWTSFFIQIYWLWLKVLIPLGRINTAKVLIFSICSLIFGIWRASIILLGILRGWIHRIWGQPLQRWCLHFTLQIFIHKTLELKDWLTGLLPFFSGSLCL